MQFKGTIDKVFDGTKTQTRRPAKDDEDLITLQINPTIRAVTTGVPFRVSRLKWVEGRDYAVQPGRGKKSVGRIRITKIHKEKLMDISLTDCNAEGIETTPGEAEGAHVPEHKERFAELWNSLYGKDMEFNRVLPEPIYVWVLEFELVERYDQ